MQTLTAHIVLVHLRAVFIFPAAVHASSVLYISPESNFLKFSPSFLSEESEVIWKPCPFQPTQVHAAVSSDDCGSDWNTPMHTCCGISGSPQKNVKASGRMVKFLKSCRFLSFFLGGCFYVSNVFPNFSFLHQFVFVCVCRGGVVVVLVLGQELYSKCVCLHQCVCFWTSAPRWLCFPSSTWPTLAVGPVLLNSSVVYLWKTLKNKGKWGRHRHFVQPFQLGVSSLCQGIRIIWLLRAPGLRSHFSCSSHFLFSFCLLCLCVSLIALLAPSNSLQAADVGSASRCFMFITLQSHL